MTHYPTHLVAGLILFAAVAAVRAIAVNTVLRRRTVLSLLLLAGYVAMNAFLAFSRLPAGSDARWTSLEQLVLALALVNFIVAVGINPWREDRVPDRFPTILQDTITVVAFIVIATVVLEEKFLTTSAVGAVVVGFALQDTLGNAFAGLAIQVEKPFHVGHWIATGQFEGQVVEITWRATKLRTKSGNLVVVPNNVMSREAITNYSEPIAPTRISVPVGVTYDAPPNTVKTALLEALANTPLALKQPAPEVLVSGFGSSSVDYEVRCWIRSFADDALAADQVRTAVYYALKRHALEIPYPIQVEYSREEPGGRTDVHLADLAALLGRVDVLAPLSDPERHALVAGSRELMFAAGEAVVRQGEPGDSMFVVESGRLRITLEPSGTEVAQAGPGGYFGEMSLLTGDLRTATVTPVTDCVLIEITADRFREIVATNPAAVERIGAVIARRRMELEGKRQTVAAATEAIDVPGGLVDRIRRFLRIAPRTSGTAVR